MTADLSEKKNKIYPDEKQITKNQRKSTGM